MAEPPNLVQWKVFTVQMCGTINKCPVSHINHTACINNAEEGGVGPELAADGGHGWRAVPHRTVQGHDGRAQHQGDGGESLFEVNIVKGQVNNTSRSGTRYGSRSSRLY